jgi:GNAT superfamily N-acetyltransferase
LGRYVSKEVVNGNENGVLHLLRLNGKVIGFTTIYKGFSSTRAESVAVLNDLYVQPSHRGHGFGKKLINNALREAKSMGYSRLQWLTAQDNKSAQKLYDGFDVNKSSWFFYAKET